MKRVVGRSRQRRRQEAGFTLIELMISLVLFSFAIAGILSIAVTMVGGFREQRISIAAESSARMAMDFIADAVRGAAPGVSNEKQIQHVQTCAIGGFSVVNSSSGPDSLVIVYPSAAVITSLKTPYTQNATTVTVNDASQLAVGDTILISNESQGHLVPITGVNVQTGVLVLGAQSCGTLALPAGGYGIGSLVIRAERVQFYVTNVDGIPTMMMDPDAEGGALAEPLAEGIEDFQVAVAVDVGGDNLISETANGANDEWFYNASGETMPATGAVRAVRIWLVARSTSPIIRGAYLRPAAGDRGVATATDAYRRRVLSSVVEIRNNEFSP